MLNTAVVTLSFILVIGVVKRKREAKGHLPLTSPTQIIPRTIKSKVVNK